MKLSEHTLEQFAAVLASNEPAPGGGSAAALEGALGTALTEMVASLTIGKKKYQDYEEQVIKNAAISKEQRAIFIDLVDKDTDAFNEINDVFAMPRDTDEEKTARKAAMQLVLKNATKTPYAMMEAALKALEATAELVGKSNASAISDLGVSALSLKAAVQGAWLNVLINIGSIEDADFAEQYRANGEEVLKKALPLADKIYADVLKELT